jgi:hypothetical protein
MKLERDTYAKNVVMSSLSQEVGKGRFNAVAKPWKSRSKLPGVMLASTNRRR